MSDEEGGYVGNISQYVKSVVTSQRIETSAGFRIRTNIGVEQLNNPKRGKREKERKLEIPRKGQYLFRRKIGRYRIGIFVGEIKF